jgi:hypothetical protein
MSWEYQILNASVHKEFKVNGINPQWLKASGYYVSTGLPKGQIADYRKRLADGRGIHVRQYANGVMTAHWDRVDPSHDLIGHLLIDAPVWTAFLAVASVVVLSAWGARSGALRA